MKTLAFVIGYAGSILALIFAVLMIFTVPVALVGDTIDDMSDELENEHVIAANEVALKLREDEVYDLSEDNVADIAADVAEESVLVDDEDYFEEAVTFVYDTAQRGIISAILVGASILFALVSFFGALLIKRKPMGGAVMVMISAIVLLLASIYTSTTVPMIIAVVMLLVAGILAFIPGRDKRYAALQGMQQPIHVDATVQFAPPAPAPPRPQPPTETEEVPLPEPDASPFPDEDAVVIDEDEEKQD